MGTGRSTFSPRGIALFLFWDIVPDMESTTKPTESIDHLIARRLRALRTERGWSLDDLAQRSGVSRASLSRLEHAEVSATAAVLGKLATAFGLSASRLMFMAEDGFAALVRGADQPVWEDAALGFTRRAVSPPARLLAGEVVEVRLRPGATVAYDGPPRPGLEHHLVMLAGGLCLTVDSVRHDLGPGDCLRYQLQGASRFEASPDDGAHYFIFMV